MVKKTYTYIRARGVERREMTQAKLRLECYKLVCKNIYGHFANKRGV